MIASSLAGALIGFWVARTTIRDQQFFTAAYKLKIAFNKELAILKHPEEKLTNSQILDKLEFAFENHLLAVTEIRYSLPKSKRLGLDNAWCNYYSNYPECNHVLLTKYSETNTKDWKQDAIKNIEAILQFTENNSFSIWYRKIF
jgi:hypothetical protein